MFDSNPDCKTQGDDLPCESSDELPISANQKWEVSFHGVYALIGAAKDKLLYNSSRELCSPYVMKDRSLPH
jgi:hypothetical protein